MGGHSVLLTPSQKERAGEVFRTYMHQHGLSITELARRWIISDSSLSSFARMREDYRATLNTAARIARGMSIDLEAFLGPLDASAALEDDADDLPSPMPAP